MDAGQNWQGRDTQLRWSGWSQARRVVVLRRALREAVAEEQKSPQKAAQQLTLDLVWSKYSYALRDHGLL